MVPRFLGGGTWSGAPSWPHSFQLLSCNRPLRLRSLAFRPESLAAAPARVLSASLMDGSAILSRTVPFATTEIRARRAIRVNLALASALRSAASFRGTTRPANATRWLATGRRARASQRPRPGSPATTATRAPTTTPAKSRRTRRSARRQHAPGRHLRARRPRRV